MTTDQRPDGTDMSNEAALIRLQAFATSVRADGAADVTVRTLLGWFGARRRGSRVMGRVLDALHQVGLGTEGALQTAGLDDTLRFYTDGREPDLVSGSAVGESPVLGRAYPAGWLEGTTTHGDPPQRPIRKPADIEAIVAAARRLTPRESEGIAERIRRHNVIPVLSFFPIRPGMKQTWWFHPLIVVAREFGSWVAVGENGFYLAAKGNQDCGLSIPFDRVSAHGVKKVEARLWRLTLESDEGKFYLLDEFVPAGAGPYLRILEAILDVYGTGGEGYQVFASWQELLQDGGKWEGEAWRGEVSLNTSIEHYPLPAWWGETATYGRRLVRFCTPHLVEDGRGPAQQKGVEAILAAFRVLTPDETGAIAARIRRYQVLPSLAFAPPRPGNTPVWWFHPLIVVAEGLGSWLSVDMNGFHHAGREGGDCAAHCRPSGWCSRPECSGGNSNSELLSHDLEQLEDRLWRLRLDYPKEFCTLDEYVRPGAGAHLQILDAILEVLMPVIETSRGKPRWYWPAAGEKYRTFDSWGALLADGGTWTA